MMEPVVATAARACEGGRRSNAGSLRHAVLHRHASQPKLKLLNNNSVSQLEDILDGEGGAGGMEGAGGRAAAGRTGGGAAAAGGGGGGSTTSRGSSSSGSSGQGCGGGGSVGGSAPQSSGGAGAAAIPATSGALTSSTQTLAVTSTPRSLSLASISSEGSTDSHMVEREEIVALTTAVRSFKEALGKLKRIFHPDRDKTETLRVAAHERLGEVLRILRTILENYSPIQHNELLAAASHLISFVNGFSYEDETADPTSFLEAIDQLALAFSSRVSEYLMGDIDSSSAVLNCSTASSRNKSCENLISSDAESSGGGGGSGLGGAGEGGGGGELEPPALKEPEVLTPQQIDDHLHRHEQGVDYALDRAKVWSKYAKDVMTYVEKRAQMDQDYARGLGKLAHSIRPALKKESFLPFQSIYCTALDQDVENSTQLSHTSNLLQTHKFIEPLTTRRNEHERARKQLKETWYRELKRASESVSNLKKAREAYVTRQQELIKAKEAVSRAAVENTEGLEKLERKKEEALQKARESETWYRASVTEANERHASLLRVKREVLQGTRDLVLQCDQTMKAVTVGYFQLQHAVAAPAPVQLQTLCESSRLYEPGSQYMEFVKRLSPAQEQPAAHDPSQPPFTFQPFTHAHDHTHNGAMTPHEDLQVGGLGAGSDTDSVGSSRSTKSVEGSPTASPLPPSRRPHTLSSGDELETDPDNDPHYGYGARRQVMSKAAVTHTFKKLKTPSRCRECDSYVYFHGYECAECGLGCHKKCLETLAIQCGHKRLPRKMTTFGVDLAQHLSETSAPVPHLLLKCVAEIDARGTKIKGIYRVSGVKSRVEKLCQAFENGAHLVDLTDQHPNVIANVLKLYLRQLPEPLLTFRLYPEFIRISKECPSGGISEGAGSGGSGSRAAEELRELVRRLPRHHLSCLATLMHHLHRLSLHSPANNMPSSNLGIVFGPTLLRTSEGSASLSSLVDTVHQTRAIELLIMHAPEVFGPPEHYPPVTTTSPGRPQHDPLKQQQQQTPARQGHTPASSSSSSSSSSGAGGVVSVPIAGYRRPASEGGPADEPPPAPHPTPPLTPLKDRKDSDGLGVVPPEERKVALPLAPSPSEDPLQPPPRRKQEEAVRRRPTLEETPRRAEEVVPRVHAVYHTASKTSLGDTELKVEVRATTADGQQQQQQALRKVSPLLTQRETALDAGVDAEGGHEYYVTQHYQTAAAAAVTGRRVQAREAACRALSVSRDPSLDNVTSSVTSSDSSSQELDSAHLTEDSHSSEAADELDAAPAHPLPYSSGYGGNSGGESGYVSPYLGAERVTLGSSMLLTRSTIAQYDTKRTITTLVAPRSSFDENRVRIQVPAAAMAAAAAASRGGAEAQYSLRVDQQEGGTRLSLPEVPARSPAPSPSPTPISSSSSASFSSASSSPPSSFPSQVSVSPGAPQQQQQQQQKQAPRKPSPNRSPRFV